MLIYGVYTWVRGEIMPIYRVATEDGLDELVRVAETSSQAHGTRSYIVAWIANTGHSRYHVAEYKDGALVGKFKDLSTLESDLEHAVQNS